MNEELKQPENPEGVQGGPIRKEDLPDIERRLNPAPTAPISNMPVPVEEEKVVGLAKFRQEMREQGRVIVPLLKLVQSMSDDFTQENILPGHFRNSMTGEDLGTETEIFVIGILHWRRFFSDRQISCASNDAIEGIGDPGGTCKICPLSKWHVIRETGEDEEVPNARTFRAKKNEEMIGPVCSEQFVFVCVMPRSEYEVPAALVFQKSALTEGYKLYSSIELAPETQVFKIMSGKTTNEKGTWFVPKVNFSRKLTEEEILKYMPMKNRIKTAIVDVEIEEEA